MICMGTIQLVFRPSDMVARGLLLFHTAFLVYTPQYAMVIIKGSIPTLGRQFFA